MLVEKTLQEQRKRVVVFQQRRQSARSQAVACRDDGRQLLAPAITATLAPAGHGIDAENKHRPSPCRQRRERSEEQHEQKQTVQRRVSSKASRASSRKTGRMQRPKRSPPTQSPQRALAAMQKLEETQAQTLRIAGKSFHPRHRPGYGIDGRTQKLRVHLGGEAVGQGQQMIGIDALLVGQAAAASASSRKHSVRWTLPRSGATCRAPCSSNKHRPVRSRIPALACRTPAAISIRRSSALP